jgi:CheY-like chemotaxis protein
MGGDIQVDSQVGRGSTFRFDVQAPAVQAPAAATAAQPITGYAGPRRKVLVVDDVAENRAVAVDLLTSLGFDVAEAADGEAGLAQVEDLRPDLLLLDVAMPKLDGLEVVRILRQQDAFRALPVIALSASVSSGDSAECLAAGMDAFLPKPLDADRLLEQIAALLHLEWTYGAANKTPTVDGPVVAPPAADMETLHRLARSGDMQGIMAYVERLAGLDERYRPFASQLAALARGYQSKAVLRFVETYRQDGAGQ